MTPQLQQAIKMLQLSNLDLADFVAAGIEENPLLEHGEHDPGDMPAMPEAETAPGDAGAAAAAPREGSPEVLAADLASDAADHWMAAAGEEGDGSLDRGG